MRAAGAPAHLLFLDHAFADDLVDRGFDERGGDGLAGESAFPVVGDGRGVGGEVAAELADRLGQFARLDADVGDVGDEVVDGPRARKTLPCQRNHFTRCSWAATSGAVSGGQRRPLACWVSTVIRIVRWNQSSRCSACGLR